jgi:hypothetical protein
MGSGFDEVDAVDKEVTEADRCRELVAAIIERAIRDAFLDRVFYMSTKQQAQTIKQEAMEWLLSEEIGLGSSSWAFEVLGLDKKSYIDKALSKGIKNSYRM